jgi:hypothetical protein
METKRHRETNLKCAYKKSCDTDSINYFAWHLRRCGGNKEKLYGRAGRERERERGRGREAYYLTTLSVAKLV